MAVGQLVLFVWSGSGGTKMLSFDRKRFGQAVRAFSFTANNNLGIKVSSGVFIYQLQAGDFSQTRKMIMVKWINHKDHEAHKDVII